MPLSFINYFETIYRQVHSKNEFRKSAWWGNNDPVSLCRHDSELFYDYPRPLLLHPLDQRMKIMNRMNCEKGIMARMNIAGFPLCDSANTLREESAFKSGTI